MGKESTNNRSEADAKASARMARYEKRQAAKKAAEAVEEAEYKIIPFWEKIGKDGSWEEKEYKIKIKKD